MHAFSDDPDVEQETLEAQHITECASDRIMPL